MLNRAKSILEKVMQKTWKNSENGSQKGSTICENVIKNEVRKLDDFGRLFWRRGDFWATQRLEGEVYLTLKGGTALKTPPKWRGWHVWVCCVASVEPLVLGCCIVSSMFSVSPRCCLPANKLRNKMQETTSKMTFWSTHLRAQVAKMRFWSNPFRARVAKEEANQKPTRGI